jgi:O-glycosyl hydrolase
MFSKDLIKKLQEIDPDGNKRVCCDGDAILFLEDLPGYFDGCFCYFDEHEYFPEKLYMDDKNDKIVIHSMDVEEFIFNVVGDLSKIDMTNIGNKKNYLSWMKKKSEEIKKMHKDILDGHLPEVLNKIKNGYTIVQDKKDKIGMFNVMFYKKDDKK